MVDYYRTDEYKSGVEQRTLLYT